VPLASELAKTDEQKQIIAVFSDTIALGRPLLAGPGVPKERVAILREAFKRTMADAEFLEEARKVNYDVAPIYGEEIQAIVTRMLTTPPAIVEKARDAITYKER
jgi:tripartite-type tricarboxylate transporter receptor subunit TctC